MKRLLHFFCFYLLTTGILFAQAPSNNTVANATQITSYPFNDNNVRIDLSNVSQGGQSGCEPLGETVVYYKFTAADNSFIDLTITDSNNGTIGENFLLFYSAPSLNVTNENQLTIASGCNLDDGNNVFAATQGVHYYVLIKRDDTNAETNISFQKINPVPQSEKNALIDIYNSTGGNSWTNKTHWNTSEPLSTWHGVTTTNKNGTLHVTKLELFDNNLTGSLPTSISSLAELTVLDLISNNLTGTLPSEVGDLTELTEFKVYDNNIVGAVPDEIWNLSKLTHLWLGSQESTSLTLPNGIPSSISNLTQLEWLNLNEIPLSQPLQPELWNLTNLNKLRILQCGISGSLPAEFAGINDIYAYGNEFEGAIPQEIINSSGNFYLGINGNYFNFSDLKPLVDANNYTSLSYSFQRTRDEAIETTSAPGDDIVFTVDDQGLNRSKSIQKNANGNVYQWFKDDMAISGATTNTYTITNAQTSDSGVYYCQISNPSLPNLIIQRANITLNVDNTAATNNQLLENIAIYPNPTSNSFTIKLSEFDNSSYILYDMNGKEILNKNIITTEEKVDVSNLKRGIYFLKITSNHTETVKRIVKI